MEKPKFSQKTRVEGALVCFPHTSHALVTSFLNSVFWKIGKEPGKGHYIESRNAKSFTAKEAIEILRQLDAVDALPRPWNILELRQYALKLALQKIKTYQDAVGVAAYVSHENGDYSKSTMLVLNEKIKTTSILSVAPVTCDELLTEAETLKKKLRNCLEFEAELLRSRLSAVVVLLGQKLANKKCEYHELVELAARIDVLGLDDLALVILGKAAQTPFPGAVSSTPVNMLMSEAKLISDEAKKPIPLFIKMIVKRRLQEIAAQLEEKATQKPALLPTAHYVAELVENLKSA